MKNQNELETLLQKNLEELKDIPTRNPQVALQRRAQFLSRAVSASEVHRHKKWMFTFRKENFAMNLIISTLVIAGLLFGGGATVYAAQDDLPTEPLYALKIWSEETNLQLQNSPQDQAAYLMTMAQTRIQEMQQLMTDGQPIPVEVLLRLQQHIQQALQLCDTMDDAVCDQTMLQIREHLQEQDRLMDQLLLNASEDVQPMLLRTRDMLRTQLQLVEDGLLLGDMNQNMIQIQNQNGQNEDFMPPAQTETGTQFSQPTNTPNRPNTDSGNSNSVPGRPNPDSGPDNSGGGNSNGDKGNKP